MGLPHGRGAGRRIGALLEDKSTTRPTRVLLKALAGFMRGLGGLLIIATLINILYSAIALINPLILSSGIDIFTNSTITEIAGIQYLTINGREFKLTNVIIFLSVMYAGLGLLGFLFNSLATRILSRVNASMVNNIRTDLYSKLINSSMGYLKNEQSGNITARITSDTDQIATGIQLFIGVVIHLLLLVATFVLVIVRTNWLVIVICVGSIPIALGVSAVLSYFGRRIVLRIRRSFGNVSGKMAEAFAGIAVSKAFNREESLSKQMGNLNQKNYKMSQQFGLMMNITMPFISTIGTLVTAAILWTGGYLQMTVGDIFLAVTLSSQFLRPVTMLSMMLPQIQTSLGATDRVMDVLEAAPAIADSSEAIPLKKNYSVEFESVWFAYNDEEWVIKDLTFDIDEGELVALVGETGAGKTTVASMLLTRFYDIQKGTITIGDQNIQDITQESLRNTIGLIPQEPYLFTATVIDNIRYGKPEATDEEIYQICGLLGADAFIQALPDGYETLVREGGKKLSAGQRQMITIARTMLADPQILVLDEATSRLDAYSESLVQDAQRKLFKNRTTFVIAHRLSTIHNAQKILVLDNGELVEMGSHEELMKLDGIYADLYKTYYSFQGLEKIDLSELEEEEEEVQLSPMAMMKFGKIDHEKVKKLMAQGKITPQMMAKLKEMREQEIKAKIPSKKKPKKED